MPNTQFGLLHVQDETRTTSARGEAPAKMISDKLHDGISKKRAIELNTNSSFKACFMDHDQVEGAVRQVVLPRHTTSLSLYKAIEPSGHLPCTKNASAILKTEEIEVSFGDNKTLMARVCRSPAVLNGSPKARCSLFSGLSVLVSLENTVQICLKWLRACMANGWSLTVAAT